MFCINIAVQITMVLQNFLQPTVTKLSDAWRNSSRMSSQSWQMMLWSYLTTYLNIKLLRRSLVRGCTEHRFDPKSCPISSYKKKLVHTKVCSWFEIRYKSYLYTVNPNPVLLTGNSLWVNSHRENPVFITGKPCSHYRIPVLHLC